MAISQSTKQEIENLILIGYLLYTLLYGVANCKNYEEIKQHRTSTI